ncbi:hypothetical protein [Phascolarctobacterium succinatutens]|uniref:hypothetical protein n=1 Tax=Phascolarctobacterium succinatutens TaxID=626940 RepID=UPI003AB1DB73
METITVTTPRGTFTGLLMTRQEAKEKGYGMYFNDNIYDIYTNVDVKTWHTDFAFVKRCN